MAVLLALTLLARLLRAWWQRRGIVRVIYPDGRRVPVSAETSSAANWAFVNPHAWASCWPTAAASRRFPSLSLLIARSKASLLNSCLQHKNRQAA